MPPFNSYSFTFTRVLLCLLEFQNLKWLVIFRSLKGLCHKYLHFRLVYFLGSLLHWLLVTLLGIFHRPVITAVCSTEFSLSALYKRAYIRDWTGNRCPTFPSSIHSPELPLSRVCAKLSSAHWGDGHAKTTYLKCICRRSTVKNGGKREGEMNSQKSEESKSKATKRKLKFGRWKQNQLGEVWTVVRIVSLVHLLLMENRCSANVYLVPPVILKDHMHYTTSRPNLTILIELEVFTVVKFPSVNLEEEFQNLVWHIWSLWLKWKISVPSLFVFFPP